MDLNVNHSKLLLATLFENISPVYNIALVSYTHARYATYPD
jgi:hypothetical protein